MQDIIEDKETSIIEIFHYINCPMGRQKIHGHKKKYRRKTTDFYVAMSYYI